MCVVSSIRFLWLMPCLRSMVVWLFMVFVALAKVSETFFARSQELFGLWVVVLVRSCGIV